jgi:glycine/D-amino acid oxidase-like deaminating enzyme
MEKNNILNYSYWEKKHLFFDYDLIVIGSGIVGLSTAISFKEKNKKAKILILEKGILPNGASLKNAGFA